MMTNDKPRLRIFNGEPMTTTPALAEHLGIPHPQVLRRVQVAFKAVPADFSRENFFVADYEGPDGKPQPMYRLTRAAVEYLAMGFGGERGAHCLEVYSAAFESLAAGYRVPADAAADITGRAGGARSVPPASAPAPAGARPPFDLVSRLLPPGITAEGEAALRADLRALGLAAMTGKLTEPPADLIARVLSFDFGGSDVDGGSAARDAREQQWLAGILAKGWAPDKDLLLILSSWQQQSPPGPQAGWLRWSYADLASEIADTSEAQVRVGLDRLCARGLVERRAAPGGGPGVEFRLNLDLVAKVLEKVPVLKGAAHKPTFGRAAPADSGRPEHPAKDGGVAGEQPAAGPGAGPGTFH